MRLRSVVLGLVLVAVVVLLVMDRLGTDKTPALPRGIPPEAVPVDILRHVDGDTLHVVPVSGEAGLEEAVDTTVRLLEIDTPESVKPGSSVECFAKKASRRLEHLLPVGSRAWALPDRDLLDPYGRTLLYLWTSDGTFVNLELVRGGYATAVLYEPNDRYIDVMRAAEAKAKVEQLGQWTACRA